MNKSLKKIRNSYCYTFKLLLNEYCALLNKYCWFWFNKYTNKILYLNLLGYFSRFEFGSGFLFGDNISEIAVAQPIIISHAQNFQFTPWHKISRKFT